MNTQAGSSLACRAKQLHHPFHRLSVDLNCPYLEHRQLQLSRILRHKRRVVVAHRPVNIHLAHATFNCPEEKLVRDRMRTMQDERSGRDGLFDLLEPAQ